MKGVARAAQAGAEVRQRSFIREHRIDIDFRLCCQTGYRGASNVMEINREWCEQGSDRLGPLDEERWPERIVFDQRDARTCDSPSARATRVG